MVIRKLKQDPSIRKGALPEKLQVKIPFLHSRYFPYIRYDTTVYLSIYTASKRCPWNVLEYMNVNAAI